MGRQVNQVAQQVLIKARAGGPYNSPTEGTQGSLGIIAPQLFTNDLGRFWNQRLFFTIPDFRQEVGGVLHKAEVRRKFHPHFPMSSA